MTFAIVVSTALLVTGQADPGTPRSEAVAFAELSPEDRLSQLKREAAEYKFYLDSAERKELVLSEPLLRFNDNVTGVVDAAQFFWTNDGHPEATASFWRRKDGLIAHEFQSLSQNRIVAKLGDQTVWHPLTPGVEPRLLPGAGEPASTAVGRLNQMRRLVRQFNAEVVKRTSRLPLRLLTQPVSRFGKDNTAVLDAAWFAFAKGTNPEVMVLIEARRGGDDGYAWYYSPVRMTSGACELKRNEVVVWTVERDRGASPESPYFNIYANE